MALPLHTHSTLARLCSMLTRWTLCRRSLLGRILESNDILHIGVESARRACDPRLGRGGGRAQRPRAVAAVVCFGGALRVLVRRASRLRMHFVVAHVLMVACPWMNSIIILL